MSNSFITIVSGLPRSGTSLMMQMLSSGGMPILTDHLRQPDADNPRGYWEFEPVKQIKATHAWLDEARGKAVKMVHLLLLDLPRVGYEYRVILMKRDMAEVIASQRAMLQRQGKAGGAIDSEQLAQIFENQMARVGNFLTTEQNFSFLSIHHRDVIEHSASVCEKIKDFLGGTFEIEKMLEAIDPNLYRQRSSITKT